MNSKFGNDVAGALWLLRECNETSLYVCVCVCVCLCTFQKYYTSNSPTVSKHSRTLFSRVTHFLYKQSHEGLYHISLCVLRIYFITHSMVHSPSQKVDRFSTSEEIPRILWDSVCSLPLSQVPATCPYPEPARSSPYLQIHLNIILPSAPRSSKLSRSLTFPHQNPVYPSPLPHTRQFMGPLLCTTNISI